MSGIPCGVKARIFSLAGFILGGALTWSFVSCQTYSSKTPDVIDFQTHIRPILENQCLECHNPVDAHRYANLNLATREKALTTGNHAPVIIPGKGEESLLYRALAVPDTHPMFMPPTPWSIHFFTRPNW